MKYATYADIVSSLMRFSVEFAEPLGIPVENILNLDAYNDILLAPSPDAFGFSQIRMEPHEGTELFYLSVAFGFIVTDDSNLRRLNTHYLDSLMQRVFPNGVIPLIDGQTGEVVGTLKSNNQYELLPVKGMDNRSIGFIHFQFLSDCGLNRPVQKPNPAV